MEAPCESTSPDGDRLLFAATRVPDGEWFSYWEIVTSDLDGSNETILTEPGKPGFEDRAPQWSPDGEMVTWMAQENEPCCGDWDVWAMNEDGSGKTNLTNYGGDPYGDMFPTWSPDATLILFQSNRATGWSMDLFSIPAPTVLPPVLPGAGAAARPQPQRLTSDGGEDGDWAPGRTATAALGVRLGGPGAGGVRSSAATPGIRCASPGHGPADCAESYPVGIVVRLSVRAATGSTFAGWRGACAGTAPTCRLTVTADTQVGAVFRRAP